MVRDEAKKGDRARLFSDPAFSQAVADEQRALAAKIALYDPDGSPESSARLLQWCTELQTLSRLVSRLAGQGSDLVNRQQGEGK